MARPSTKLRQRPRAVLATSDIQGPDWIPGTPRNPVAEHAGVELYSSNILENLIMSGYDIWVVAETDELRECDEWWYRLLPDKSQVIMAEADAAGTSDPLSGWRRLYRRLNLTWCSTYRTGYHAAWTLQLHGYLIVVRKDLDHRLRA